MCGISSCHSLIVWQKRGLATPPQRVTTLKPILHKLASAFKIVSCRLCIYYFLIASPTTQPFTLYPNVTSVLKLAAVGLVSTLLIELPLIICEMLLSGQTTATNFNARTSNQNP